MAAAAPTSDAIADIDHAKRQVANAAATGDYRETGDGLAGSMNSAGPSMNLTMVLAFALAAENARLFELPCPSVLQTEQRALLDEPGLTLVSPLSADGGARTGRLSGIGFRVADPRSDQILAPNTSDEMIPMDGGKAHHWPLSGKQTIWLTCHYEGTYLVVAAEMPREPLDCYALYDVDHVRGFDRGWCLR